MTTREKIIVGIMCLTIVYGAYELLFARNYRKSAVMPKANPAEGLSSFVVEIGKKLNSDKIGQSSPYIITQAGATWDKDPFINSTSSLQKSAPSIQPAQQQIPAADRPDFVYSGFMQMGDTKMAIINGLEYAVGDALPDNAFYIKSITPAGVSIARIGGAETILIPIRESDAEGQD